ncbi:MAG TPA: adenylate/guanylate cyclase domain-containing protein [Roseiflexaceae bacterium]|nr:adenylate/guanylate cyclase domain-containing protein [Roseiflexaceae bacterium]
MDSLSPYIPADRLRALARGEPLPDRATGAALFADISGFTPLTEALARTLGPRGGAEELTRQLNSVYDALIAEVDRYGGSVIAFSGDAITCWFEGDNGLRATACALALHVAMACQGTVALPSGGRVTLALKVAISSGPARRLVVGDPAIQRFDVLVGAALARMAAAQHLAHRAEVVLSPECAPALEDHALVLEWRSPAEDPLHMPERYPVISGLLTPVDDAPWPALADGAVREDDIRPWLLPAVYRQLRTGQDALLTELRPAVALFLRFNGLDYDADPAAEARLDEFVRWVQQVLARYEGVLLQISNDDKGSHLYGVFGAPSAHEDDARRAVAAALELRIPPADLAARSGITVMGIGLSQGTMRAGVYGGATRRTYSVLGDEVNVAARLMQQAGPGEVLASDQVRQSTAASFTWDLLPPLVVKGRRAPVAAARLVGALASQPAARGFVGDLVGRAGELNRALRALAPILEGRFAGVVAIYGEAGIGKSRLAEELRRRLSYSRRSTLLTWIACPSDPLARQSLAPLRYGLRDYFQQDADRSEARNRASFNATLDELMLEVGDAPELVLALEHGRSFLGALLDLHWDHSAYAQTKPDQRRAETLTALVALLRAVARSGPLVLYLEDALWLDEDSRALIQALTQTARGEALAVLLTSRYRADGRTLSLPIDERTPQHTLRLSNLSPDETRALAAQTLGGPLDNDLAAFLTAKTGGNPLFVEQLTLDLRERGALITGPSRLPIFGLRAGTAGDSIPDSLGAALVARLDRLPPQVRTVVQAAAVLGLEFEERVLARVQPEAGNLAIALRQAARESIWDAQSAGRYRFRHALLRDAAYSMQPGERLRALHGRAGAAIEQIYADDQAAHVAALAYHYREAGDAARERHFVTLLGEQAFNISAFRAALACFERALALVDPDDPALRGRLLALQARAYVHLGASDEARQAYRTSLDLADQAGDLLGSAEVACELGALATRQGDHSTALAYLERGLERYRAVGHPGGESRALNLLGGVYIALGDGERALASYEQALRLGRQGRS